jgi:hypothetical protein
LRLVPLLPFFKVGFSELSESSAALDLGLPYYRYRRQNQMAWPDSRRSMSGLIRRKLQLTLTKCAFLKSTLTRNEEDCDRANPYFSRTIAEAGFEK